MVEALSACSLWHLSPSSTGGLFSATSIFLMGLPWDLPACLFELSFLYLYSCRDLPEESLCSYLPLCPNSLFLLAGVQRYLPDSQSMLQGVSVSPKMLKMRLFRSHHTPASPGTGWNLSGGSEWARIWKRLQCRLPATNPLPFLLGLLSSVTLSCLPLGTRRKETSFLRPTPPRPCSFWFWHQQSQPMVAGSRVFVSASAGQKDKFEATKLC